MLWCYVALRLLSFLLIFLIFILMQVDIFVFYINFDDYADEMFVMLLAFIFAHLLYDN